ncbi:MAG: SMP-30/gluconolactonase/LRE family protein [Variovorax sp.]
MGTTRDRVGESPVWDSSRQTLTWVDIDGRSVRRFDWAGQATRSWQCAERVGCIALTDRGSVIAAMETGIFEVELGANAEVQASLIAPAKFTRDGIRFNDGRCDAEGRFWVSAMCMDMGLAASDGALHVLDEAGLSPPVVSGLITPNGLAFSGDGRHVWLSDSHPSVQQIWRFARDPASGALSERTAWVDMRALPGRPDGAAVDAQDHYWICGNDAGLIHRFDPDGRLVQSLPVPVPKPAMCCFGGPDLQTLFVTSIQPPRASAPEVGAATPEHGALFACEVDVRGRVEPRFTRFPKTPSPASVL